MTEPTQSLKYTFICDPDKCDIMIEITTSDKFGFPGDTSQLRCPCGRDTNLILINPTKVSLAKSGDNPPGDNPSSVRNPPKRGEVTANGAIIADLKPTWDGYIALCVRVNVTADPYVTWKIYRLADGLMHCYSGHYYSQLPDAIVDFNNRI
jgi:hypothetical protein